MPKKSPPLSPWATEALGLLSTQIKTARTEKKMTAQDLAQRAGISRGLVQRIENANPGCSIGVIFEVAAILGISLFQTDGRGLAWKNKMAKDKLTLLPRQVRRPRHKIDDDF